MYISTRRRRGQGSIIGAAFLLLILLTGYTLFQLNLRSQMEYQDILSEAREVDLRRLQEEIEYRRVRTDSSDKLILTLRNKGPNTAHIILLGVFYMTLTPETQTYYNISVYMKPSETLTYENSAITLPSGGDYVIQLVTELGNIFSTSFTPGTEVSDETTISITPGPSISEDNYPSSFSIEQGSYQSGTLPASVQYVDGNYLEVRKITPGPISYATTVFTITGLVSDSIPSLWFKVVCSHDSSVYVEIQAYNYLSGGYASSGQGYTSYTANNSNDETKRLNIISGASNFVLGGEAKIRVSSSRAGPSNYVQKFNQMIVDYSYPTSVLSYNTPREYAITVSDAITGDPRPYTSLVIFSNGTSVSFEGLPNPAYVNTDADGVYNLILKSSTIGGETFRLYVLAGSVAAEKNIQQQP